MLKSAVYNNLKLLLSPKEAFESFFFPNQDTISLESFEKHVPFFSDMDFIVNSILRYHQKNQLQHIEKHTFFEKMEKVLELFNSKRDIGFDDYRKGLFQRLTQRSVDDIINEIRGVEDQKRVEEERKVREERERREAEQRRIEEERLRAEAQERARREAEEKARKAAEVAKQQNFFDTVAGSTGDVFDITEDIELPATPPPPKNEEIYTPPPVFNQQELSPPPPPVEQPSTILDGINSQSPKSPSTIEEAISAFINKDNSPQKTVMDGFNPPVEQNKEQQIVQPPVPPVQEEKPIIPPVTPPAVNPPVEQQHTSTNESSQSFLSRFLKEEEPPVDEKNNVHAVLNAQTSERPQTLAEKLQNQHQTAKVALNGHGTEIKLNEIPIHRQYQYVQKVFEGNNVRFRIIVDKVNNAKTKEEVENIIDRFVFSNEKLDRNDEVVKEFINMLRNRF